MSHWVYHPEKEAMIVQHHEYENHLENGWYDTPAKFPVKPEKVEGLFAEKGEEAVKQEEIAAVEDPINQQLRTKRPYNKKP